MFKNKKLEWKKLCRERYYALSPFNNFVFYIEKYPVGWSNQIIFKKHLKKLIKDFGMLDSLNVEDLTTNDSRHSMIDCTSHTLRGSKAEFQKYVDCHSTYPKHSWDFYKLKDYAKDNQ